MEVQINSKTLRISRLTIIYLLLYSVFGVYLISDLSYNTAFVDEAIYATVGEEVLRGSYWENALTWMGGSYLYPLISALINRSFGLTGIRFFSAMCVLFAGFTVSKIAEEISGKRAGLISLFIFLSSSLTLSVGQLGTYDAPAILFFSISLYLSFVFSRFKGLRQIPLIFFSGFTFSLAVLSKYVAIILAPVVLSVIFWRSKFSFTKSIIWGFSAAIVIGSFVLLEYEQLLVFFTGSAFKEITDRTKIIEEALKHIHVYIPIAFFGGAWLLLKKPTHRLVILSLLIGSLVPFGYHFASGNIRSMWKHLLFSLILIAPIAGSVLEEILKKLEKRIKTHTPLSNALHIIITVLALIVMNGIWENLQEHWKFQRSWPSASSTLEFLRENRRESDRIFAEGSAVFKYHLFAGFGNPDSWTSTWYLEYQGASGVPAMKSAIEDQYFDFVILNGYFTGDILYELRPYLEIHYTLLHEDTYKLSGIYDTTTSLWGPKGSGREYILSRTLQ